MRRNFLFIVFFLLPIMSTAGNAMPETGLGYSLLRLFLDDEQYLTAIRRAKTVINLDGTNDQVSALIDEIADTSETACEQLEALATEKPAVEFASFNDTSITLATLDDLRFATAKTLIIDGENFEKNMMLSQIQVLPVITQIATRLAENENNPKRKNWLLQLAAQYSDYYRRVHALLDIATTRK